jgi:hypothetical protein
VRGGDREEPSYSILRRRRERFSDRQPGSG